MKKETLHEFQALVKEKTEHFYRLAYAVKGNQADAEALTEEALIYGAKKFKGLANKARVLDIISEKIGKGTFSGFEEMDYEAIFARVMEKISVQDKKKKLLTSVCAGVLVVVVGVSAVIGFAPKEATGEFIMRNTAVFNGDLGKAQLVNYQNISSKLGVFGKSAKVESEFAEIERAAAVVTAPDGNLYMAHHNFEDNNSTFTFYRANEDGWEALGSGDITVISSFQDGESFVLNYPSDISLIADNDSNVYLFVIYNETIMIYKYDSQKEIFSKSYVEIPFMVPDSTQTVTPYYDASYGEKGTIYLGCNKTGYVDFIRYDIATDSISYMINNMYLSSGTVTFDYVVKNNKIHMVLRYTDAEYAYCVLTDGQKKLKKTTIFKGSFSIYDGIGESLADILMDKNGNIHIISTQDEWIPGSDKWSSTAVYRIVHYIIDENGEVKKGILNQLCFEDMEDYDVFAPDAYIGEDGTLYYIEVYKTGAHNMISIGRLDENDPSVSTLYDCFEISNNISRTRVWAENQDFLIYTDDDRIVYFNMREMSAEK